MYPTYFLAHFNLVELAHVLYCTVEPVLESLFGNHFLKVRFSCSQLPSKPCRVVFQWSMKLFPGLRQTNCSNRKKEGSSLIALRAIPSSFVGLSLSLPPAADLNLLFLSMASTAQTSPGCSPCTAMDFSVFCANSKFDPDIICTNRLFKRMKWRKAQVGMVWFVVCGVAD